MIGNDQDLIQRNQIVIMEALARIVTHVTSNRRYADDLLNASKETQEHLNWKLAGSQPLTSSPNLVEIAKATETNPWPDDLGGTEKAKWR